MKTIIYTLIYYNFLVSKDSKYRPQDTQSSNNIYHLFCNCGTRNWARELLTIIKSTL